VQKNNQVIFLGLAIFCIVVDQLTKFLAEKFIDINQTLTVLPDILSITKVYNTGAAFSLFNGSTVVLILISIAALLLILTFVLKKDSTMNKGEVIGLAFIAGGAVGNLIDRLIYLHVIDFLQIEFITFPIFNFADIFINIGVIILIVSILMCKHDK